MATVTRLNIAPYTASYYAEGDVMYLSKGEPVEAYTQDDECGLLWRIAFDGNVVCGLTIEDFENNWHEKTLRLADKLEWGFKLAPTASRRLAEDLNQVAARSKKP